jgi:hypothetical protein
MSAVPVVRRGIYGDLPEYGGEGVGLGTCADVFR